MNVKLSFEVKKLPLFSVSHKNERKTFEIQAFDGILTVSVQYDYERAPLSLNGEIALGDRVEVVMLDHRIELYINGELIAERKGCDTWTAENVHVNGVRLTKGENRIVWRLTRVNADAKYNLIFSTGATCATHYVCMGSVHPQCF